MDYKTKYLKYKNKYLTLKMYGGNPSTILARVKKFFEGKDICSKDDLFISEFRSLSASTGATQGHGGALVYFGNINAPDGIIPVVVKFFSLLNNSVTEDTKVKTDKAINEIGITHYISHHFLKDDKKNLTDNFTVFYYNIKCSEYITKAFEQSKALLTGSKVPPNAALNNDSNIMIVEKLSGDLKGYIKNNIANDNFFKVILSILIQIALTLLVFNKEFGYFEHRDFHCGNVLLLIDPTKAVKKIRYTTEAYEYKINLNTYNIIPKIWDLATAYLGVLNDQFKKNVNPTPFFDYLGTLKPVTHSPNAGKETGITKDFKFLLEQLMGELNDVAKSKSIANITTSPLFLFLKSNHEKIRNVSQIIDSLIEELKKQDPAAVYSWDPDEKPVATQAANVADAQFVIKMT